MQTMLTKDVAFFSGPALRLSGRMYLPQPKNDRRAGIVFCLGFGGVKEGTPVGMSTLLAEHGYTVLAFDYRGFGGSDGPRGRLVPDEQAEDTVHALSFLSQQDGIDPRRIGVYGTSFGGGVAILAARRSELPRAAFVSVPVSSGSQWLQSITRWHEFQSLKKRAAQAIAKKTISGEIEMVDRFDIMLPDPLTGERYKTPFPLALETFSHVMSFEPVSEAAALRIPVAVVGVHDDPLVPVSQAIMLHERLGGEKRLHLLEGDNHYVVYEEKLPLVAQHAAEWFDRHLLQAGSPS